MTQHTRPPDHYQVLGIQPTSTIEAVRQAYRALARELHPDVNPSPDAARRFAEITQAYRILSDPVQRRLYDEQRRQGSVAGVSVQPHRAPPPSRGVLRGGDVELPLHVSLRDAALGAETRLEVPRREVCAICVGTGTAKGGTSMRCPTCLGTGGTRSSGDECPRCLGSGVIGEPPCPNCGGAGRKQGLSQLTVAIPPAVEDGQRLVLKGEGHVGPRNGPRGDLILRVAIDPDPVLRRAGIDILMDLELTAAEAADGTSVEVPTLRGTKRLRVPGGAHEGQILRLSGAGIRPRGMLWHRGDQFVTVHVRTAVASPEGESGAV